MKNTIDQIIKNIPKEDMKNPTILFLLQQFEQQFEIILTLTDLVKNSSSIDRKPFSHGKFDRNWTLAGLSFQFPVSSSQSALRKFAVTAH